MSEEMRKLIEEETVCGFTIRPWGITALAKLSPTFEAIYRDMKARGVQIRAIRDNLEGLIFSLLPHAPAILSVTLGIKESEIDEKVKPGDLVPIVLTIFRLNIDYLKNWSAPVKASVEVLATESEKA